MSKDQAALLRSLVEKRAGQKEPEVTPVVEEVETCAAPPRSEPSQPFQKPALILIPAETSTNLEAGQEEKAVNPIASIEITEPKKFKQLLTLNHPKVVELTKIEEAIVEEVSPIVEEPVVEASPEICLAEDFAEEGIRVIAVCSGKGGVGKTNVVLNMAIALKRQGKNPLIIDTDFGFTNIDVLCGMAIPYTLQDVLKGERQLGEIVTEGPEGVRIISGGNDVVQLREMDDAHRQIFEEQFAQLTDVDTLLIDMGAGVSRTALMYASFAQEILLVATPEATSLTDAYSLLKIMDLAHLQKPVKVLVNRATNEDEALQSFKKLDRTVSEYLRLNIEYLSYIRDDRSVSLSARAQVPFLLKYPDSPPAKDILRVTRELFETAAPSRLKSMQEVMGRLFRVFGR